MTPTTPIAPTVPTPPAIGREQVRAAMDTLRRYKAGKANLERRIIENEQFWKLRHWEQMNGGSDGDPRPASGWLVNVVLNRHADAIDNYPEPNCLPRAADDVAEARKLTRILPVILKQNGFAQVYSDCWWYKLKAGTACYGVFWDTAKWNGLGDIAIRKCDILNLFWQPGVTDIQQSRNLFHVELVDNDALTEQYPQLADKLKPFTETVSHYIYDDTVDTSGKSLVVDWYYKRRGVLHYCKFVGEEVLFATENETRRPTAQRVVGTDESGAPIVELTETGPSLAERGWYDHGKYPFVLDVLFPEEGTPCGYGYVDICKDPQKQIDLMNQAILKNTLAAATPRYFIRADGSVNEAEFADWSRPFVHTEGNLGQDSILPIASAPLGGAYLQYLQMKVQEMRDTSGNTEANTGAIPSGVTAASAIAALQEASGKLSRDMVEAGYRSYEELCLMVIDLIRQFYDLPRTFRITGELGAEDFTVYDNSGLRPQPLEGPDGGYRSPVIDIEVAPQNESRYTKAEYNELALQLFGAGLFRPDLADQALACLEMMDFKGRDAVMRRIAENAAAAMGLAASDDAPRPPRGSRRDRDGQRGGESATTARARQRSRSAARVR